jgi:hypothetical protein
MLLAAVIWALAVPHAASSTRPPEHSNAWARTWDEANGFFNWNSPTVMDELLGAQKNAKVQCFLEKFFSQYRINEHSFIQELRIPAKHENVPASDVLLA